MVAHRWGTSRGRKEKDSFVPRGGLVRLEPPCIDSSLPDRTTGARVGTSRLATCSIIEITIKRIFTG